MSFEEEFDRIIRQKSEDLKYPLDEKNWEAARRMIDADRERSPRAGFFRVYSPAIILTLIGLGALVVVNQVAPVEKEKEIAVSFSDQNSERIQTIAHSDLETKAVVAKSTELSKPVETGAVNANQPGSASNIHESSAGNAHVSIKPVVKQHSTAATKEAKNSTLATAVHVEPEATGTADVESPSLAESSGEVQTDVAAYLVPVHMSLPVVPRQYEVLAEISSVNKDDDYYGPAAKKRHLLEVAGGTAFMNGWSTSSGTDARGLSWYAGINYGFCLGTRWLLGTGLLAYSVGNIKKPFHAATEMQYDFASVTSQTIVTANALYYIAVPLMLYYNIDKNNRLGGGINTSFLTGSHNTVNTYKVQDGSNTLLASARNYGRYDGVATTSILLCVSYSTRLSNRFFVKAEALYGLNDLFKNTTYKNDAENPLGLRVGIQYTLLEK